jgi:hypothetical protein
MTDDELLELLRLRARDPEMRISGRSTTVQLRAPATEEEILEAESAIGARLHPLLRRLYAEIANGGFGPGYGLLRLGEGSTTAFPRSLLETYADFQRGGVAKCLLPLWEWGDSIWSCVDMKNADGRIVTHDSVVGPTETRFTLPTWLAAWASGIDLWKEIYEDVDAIIINPFTKKPAKTKVRGRAIGRT